MHNKGFSKALLLMLIVCIMFFTGCSRVVEVNFNGERYILEEVSKDNLKKTYISESNRTITVRLVENHRVVTVGDEKYIVSGSRDYVTVEYPNGESTWMKYMDNGGYAGGGDVEGYPSVTEFRELVFDIQKKKEFNGMQFLAGIFVFAVSILCALRPETAWFFNRGWMYRNAEPSDAYLSYTKVMGVIGCIFSVLLIFSSCS
jgi:hypothetical protein